MASQNRRMAEYDKRADRNTVDRNKVYVYDNLARSRGYVWEEEERNAPQISNEARKNRDKALFMNPGYVLFLVAALCCAGLVLVNYLQLQAEVTRRAEVIAELECELNSLRLNNDEEYNRILNSVDMEQIKYVAIHDLGMTYASEGNVCFYANEGSDYMRRVAD